MMDLKNHTERLYSSLKDIDRSFLYIFLIKKFHRNIVFFAYDSIYHWKGNYNVLILVKILLKNHVLVDFAHFYYH